MPKGRYRPGSGDYQNGQRQDYVGIRLGAELRARAIHAAEQLDMSLSTWIRMAIENTLNYGLSGGLSGDPADPQTMGFTYGRTLGLAIAQAQMQNAIRSALDAPPMTFEEANERFPGGHVPWGAPHLR